MHTALERRKPDKLRPLSMFLFMIGLLHFRWYILFSFSVIVLVRLFLIILFTMFWPIMGPIAREMGKTRVTADCKHLNDCDVWFDLFYERQLNK
jgi:hypothetical protein